MPVRKIGMSRTWQRSRTFSSSAPCHPTDVDTMTAHQGFTFLQHRIAAIRPSHPHRTDYYGSTGRLCRRPPILRTQRLVFGHHYIPRSPHRMHSASHCPSLPASTINMRPSMDVVCYPPPDVPIKHASAGKYGWRWPNPPLDAPCVIDFTLDRSRSPSDSFLLPPYDAIWMAV